jgi:hypothetical protein
MAARRTPTFMGREESWYGLFATEATTFDDFAVRGGLYQLSGEGTIGTGDVFVYMLGPDGSTWQAHTDLTLGADGYARGILPPGLTRVRVVGNSTDYNVKLTRIPQD